MFGGARLGGQGLLKPPGRLMPAPLAGRRFAPNLGLGLQIPISIPIPITIPIPIPTSHFPQVPSPPSSPPKKSRLVIEFHVSVEFEIHFETCKQTDKLMVIFFTASWCGPGRQMEPTIHVLADMYTDVEFVKIDKDENAGLADLAKKYGVETVPTFLLMKRGKEVDRVEGNKKEELQKKIEKHRL